MELLVGSAFAGSGFARSRSQLLIGWRNARWDRIGGGA
jgi:hypothetical protein